MSLLFGVVAAAAAAAAAEIIGNSAANGDSFLIVQRLAHLMFSPVFFFFSF